MGRRWEKRSPRNRISVTALGHVMARDVLLLEANAYPCKREHELRNYISFFTAGMFLPFDFLPTVSVKCIICLKKALKKSTCKMQRASSIHLRRDIVKSCRADMFSRFMIICILQFIIIYVKHIQNLRNIWKFLHKWKVTLLVRNEKHLWVLFPRLKISYISLSQNYDGSILWHLHN